ncbi:MAG TPA: 4-hydroxythreonine-4-phosphate dehydrogenase PdxA [Burkholderiaceae bacterium]|nr:4-hydroxythreonine-4-phosphate dehydrogenase PdxA [Burkholderiaceae bacterium]
MKRIALSTGEPAGIGPQIAKLAQAQTLADAQVVLIGDRGLLASAAGPVVHVPLGAPVVPGQLDVRNAPYVLQVLDRAIAGIEAGEFDAVVTAPVHKGIINDAGVPFTGHTEYFAQKTGREQVVMLLAGEHLRVALATTHLPLSQVAQAISFERLSRTLDVLHEGLITRFGLARPRIAVCALNPHAGEGGHLGREEIDIIAPAIAAGRERGMDLTGPLPADTVFVPAQAQQYDAILAMYHDQGLAPFKQVNFGQGVNVTLGLPFVRTSVDHGVALSLAQSGQADAASLCAAVRLALRLQ